MSYAKYKEVVLSNFSGGLNTKFDDNQIADSESPNLQNIEFNGRNSFGPRKGISMFGTSVAPTTNVSNTNFNTTIINRLGEQFPFRQYGGTIQYYNAAYGDYTMLYNSLTAGYDLGVAYFGNLSMDDFAYFCNGVNTMMAWHPRSGVVSGATSASATVIYLSTSNALSALGWLSAGSAIVNNEAIYYSSLSANALSSITRSSSNSNIASGDPIAQYPISSYRFTYNGATNTYSLSAVPKGNILKTFQARLFVAGISTSRESLVYSKINNPWDVTYNSITSAGDGGVVAYSEGGGYITGLANKDDKLVVYKDGTIRSLSFSESDMPVPGTIIEGINLGAINQNSISNIEGLLNHVSPTGIVRELTPNQNANGYSMAQKSMKINPSLAALNLTSASSIYHESKLYITAATSGSTFNNTVFVYDYTYDAWSKYTGINAKNFFIYENGLYYGASNEIASYQMLDGYDDNEFGYEAFFYTKKLDFGIPEELKKVRYVYVEGYLTTNTALKVDLYYNGDTSPISKTISGTGAYVDISNPVQVIGKATFGKSTYGGENTTEVYNLYPFRVRLSYDNVDFFNMQLKFSTDQPGYLWKISYIAPYVMAYDGKKFPIDNII